MPEKLLGIDIGPTSVKALLAVKHGRAEARVLAVETAALDETLGLDGAIARIAEKIRPLMPSGCACVVGLPPTGIMFRHLFLPFRDEKKIRKTLPFELETVLPLPVEEVVADYLLLPSDGLLAAACQRDTLSSILSSVETHLGHVAAIDIGAAATTLALLEQKKDAAGLLLDVGQTTSVAVFYEKNFLIEIRAFAFGGQTLTDALARDLLCDAETAEQTKITAGYPAELPHTDEVCRQFCVELANTAEYLRLHQMLQTPLAQITVSGGGALYAPLCHHLEKSFGVAVDRLNLPGQDLAAVAEKAPLSAPPQIFHTALACVKGAWGSKKSFNFRRGEFAAKNMLTDFGGQLKRAAIVAGILLMLFLTAQALDYEAQSLQAKQLKTSLTSILKKHVPSAVPMGDPVLQLKNKLAEERKTYGLDGASSGATVLGLIRELSARIPAERDIVVTHLHYENRLVLLKGEAGNIDDVTAVKDELAKSRYLQSVSLGATSLKKDGSKVDFDLKMELP